MMLLRRVVPLRRPAARLFSVSVDNANVVPGKPFLLNNFTVIPVKGKARGRARLAVKFSDGTEAVANYHVLPPLHTQIDRVAHHWSEVAWLPRDYPDPFGRSASVMPWDRED